MTAVMSGDRVAECEVRATAAAADPAAVEASQRDVFALIDEVKRLARSVAEWESHARGWQAQAGASQAERNTAAAELARRCQPRRQRGLALRRWRRALSAPWRRARRRLGPAVPQGR